MAREREQRGLNNITNRVQGARSMDEMERQIASGEYGHPEHLTDDEAAVNGVSERVE